jgi:hypothetical protein
MSRLAWIKLLSVISIAARAGAATSIGRIGSGCLAFTRAMMRSRQLRLCRGFLSAQDELQRELVFLLGGQIVRQAPPSQHCSTWRRRRLACACVPSGGGSRAPKRRRDEACPREDGVGCQEHSRSDLGITGLRYVAWIVAFARLKASGCETEIGRHVFDLRKRLGSSTAALKVSAATKPTPGADISNWQLHVRGTPCPACR